MRNEYLQLSPFNRFIEKTILNKYLFLRAVINFDEYREREIHAALHRFG